jgi:RNA polymerase sigma factor (sigma-70 family)
VRRLIFEAAGKQIAFDGVAAGLGPISSVSDAPQSRGSGADDRRHHGHLWRLADGRGLHAPPGRLVHHPESGAVCCHFCGRWFMALGSHVRAHGFSAAGYRRVLQLEKKLPLSAPGYARAVSDRKKSDHAVQRQSAPPHRISDAELATLTGEHRSEALAAIYERHYMAVRRRIEWACGHAAADDVAQDVFLSFARRADRYNPAQGSLRNYLVTIASRRAVDSFRCDNARRSRETAVMDADIDQTDVEREVLGHLDAARVNTLMAGLPSATQRALTLAYMDGYSYRQVAAIMGQPEGTVKSRIRLGLTILRANMAH